MRAMRLAITLALAGGAAAATGATRSAAQEPVKADSARPALAPGQIPPGFGTLKQDAFTVSLRSGALLVKVTPLAEQVIRLAAPDTYTRLHALAESRRAEAARRVPGGDPQLFLVSFFSYQPDVPFQPEDLQLIAAGRTLRPAAFLPMSAGWGKQRLGQQEAQAAIYVFDASIDYGQPLTVRNGMDRSDSWSDVVQVLDQERGKVMARAHAQ
ncbi:MAG TPA: hypothetical protein VF832_07495 [Longimicrobiales bacterium]